MKDEFNRLKENSYNKKIKEFKRFDAVEYYKPKEIKPLPPEVIKFKEGFNDKDIKIEEGSKNPLRKKMDERNEDFNKNKNDEYYKNDIKIENAEGADVSSGSLNASTEAAVQATTVTSTTASLAGGASLISACIIAAATIGSKVMNEPPSIELISIETGTDYLVYEIDVTKMTEGTDYLIRVSNDSFKEDFPIENEGTQRQIVSGLSPNEKYTITVYADADDAGLVRYDYFECYTSKLKKPEAAFKFYPHTTSSEENGQTIFNIDYNLLDYSVFISDYYKVGYQTYLEIYYDDKLVIKDTNLDPNNYFTGFLNNAKEGQSITAKAYTTYYGKLTEIGSYNTLITFPEYIKEKKFNGLFSIDEPLITTSDTHFNLSIDTGFESSDINDAYIIDVYKKKEDYTLSSYKLNASESDALVLSVEGKSRMANLEIPKDISSVDIYFTPIKRTDDFFIKYETKLIGTYNLNQYKTKKYESEYHLQNKDITVDFINSKLIVDTGFIKKADDESYKLILNDGNNSSELISTESIVSFDINPLVRNYQITLTPLKQEEEFDGEKTINHIVEEPLKNLEFYIDSYSYSLSGETTFDLKEESLTLKLTIYLANNEIIETKEIGNEFGVEGSMPLLADSSISIDDIKKIDAEVFYKENKIQEFSYLKDDAKLELEEHEVTSDADILIPYNVTLNDGTLTNLTVDFVNGEASYTSSLASSHVIIEDLKSSLLEAMYLVTYKKNGITYKKAYEINDNFDVDVLIDSYASYASSYGCAYFKATPTIDGVVVNKDIDFTVRHTEETYNETGTPATIVQNYISVDEQDIPESLERNRYGYNIVEFYKDSASDTAWHFEVSFNDTLFNFKKSVSYSIDLNELESVKNQYEASYDGSGLYLKKNEDGKDHYYFGTNFSTELSGFKEKIYYSYKKNGITYYGESDYFTSNKHELILDEGIEYNFYCAIFYQFSNGDYVYLSGMDMELYDNQEELSDAITYASSNQTIIEFNMLYGPIKEQTVKVSYLGVDYDIILDSSRIDAASASYIIDNYTVRGIYRDEELSLYNVKITIDSKMPEYIESLPTIKYEFYPMFDSLYPDLDMNDFKFDITKEISGYSSTYKLEKTYDVAEAANFELSLDINFDQKDSNDILILEAYDEKGVLLTSETLIESTSRTTLFFDPIEKCHLYLIKAKQKADASASIVTKFETVDLGEHIFNPIKDPVINVSSDGAYFRGNIYLSGFTYRITKTPVLSDEPQVSTGEFDTASSSEFDINLGFDSNYSTFKVEVINSFGDVVKTINYIPVDISDYEYVDGDDYITLDYEVFTDEDIYLSIDSEYASKKGTLEIYSLDSNIVSKTFQFYLDGTYYTYVIEKELEVTLDIDYEITSHKDSSAIGFLNEQYAYSDGIVYHNEGGQYLDEDGNEAPDDAITYINYRFYYLLTPKVSAKVGCFDLDYTDYEIQVIKSGQRLTNYSSRPDILDGNYTISGDIVSDSSIVMYLTPIRVILDNGNYRFVANASVEFDLTYQGKTVHKEYIYDEPENLLSATDFNLDGYTQYIEAVGNGNIDIRLDTGFDDEAHSNLYYKVVLYEANSDNYTSTYNLEKIAESDITNSPTVIIENVPNKIYTGGIIVYYYDGEKYIEYDCLYNTDTFKLINSALVSRPVTDMNTTTNKASVTFSFDKTRVEDGSSISVSVNAEGVSTLAIAEGEGIALGDFCTATVTLKDNIYTVYIETRNYSYSPITISLSEGDSDLGYTERTYSINY